MHNSPSQSSQKSLSSQCSDERSNYNTYPKSTTILYLPKEYNPVLQLIALENLETFTSKVLLNDNDISVECNKEEHAKITMEIDNSSNYSKPCNNTESKFEFLNF